MAKNKIPAALTVYGVTAKDYALIREARARIDRVNEALEAGRANVRYAVTLTVITPKCATLDYGEPATCVHDQGW